MNVSYYLFLDFIVYPIRPNAHLGGMTSLIFLEYPYYMIYMVEACF